MLFHNILEDTFQLFFSQHGIRRNTLLNSYEQIYPLVCISDIMHGRFMVIIVQGLSKVYTCSSHGL